MTDSSPAENVVTDSSPDKGVLTPDDRDWLLAQYEALRHEIDQRIGQNNQFLAVGISALGVIAAVAVQNHSVVVFAAFVFAAVCLALGIAWGYNARRIGKLGRFIEGVIEVKLCARPAELGWEHWKSDTGWRHRIVERWRHTIHSPRTTPSS